MQNSLDKSQSVMHKKTMHGKMKIMLVEDDPILCAMMKALLKQWNHEVIIAVNGLECVQLLKSVDFDLVLLDLQMPVMDGFDVLRWVRTHCDTQQCQFIVLSTTNDVESVIRAFDLGADDYVSKPIEPKIFEAKLRNIVARWRQSKINSMLLDSLELKETQLKKQLDHECLLADKIHNVMLRGEDRLCISGFNVASYSKAAKQVNGDFWDVYSLRPGTLDVIFGDVMGKGPLAAILAEQIKGKFLRSILNDLHTDNFSQCIPTPSDIVNKIHSSLTSKLIEIDTFITLIYLRIDRVSNTISTVSCGHAPALRLRKSGIDELGNSQLPLGVLLDEVYRQHESDFLTDDKIFMASDGVFEKRNKNGEFYHEGMRKIIDFFAASDYGIGSLVGAMVNDIEKFSNNSVKGDDMTILLVDHSDDSSSHTRFSLKKDLSLTVVLRDKIADFLKKESFSDDLILHSLMACTEIFTNVVLHAVSEIGGEQIDWKISSTDDFFVITVEYSGDDFDPTVKVGLPTIDLSTDGGLGLYLIQSLCSGMSREYAFGVNKLVLEFKNTEGVDCGN